MIIIEIANPGFRPVTISSPYIRLPRGDNLMFPWPTANVQFPYELGEGKSCCLWVEETEIKQSLKKQGYSGKVELIAYVSDQTGKKYKAKKALKYDVGK
jgi:hypothetical protein